MAALQSCRAELHALMELQLRVRRATRAAPLAGGTCRSAPANGGPLPGIVNRVEAGVIYRERTLTNLPGRNGPRHAFPVTPGGISHGLE